MSWMALMGRAEDAPVERMMDTFARCHQGAALRNNNASSVALQLAASAGAIFPHSVASSLLTFGDKHGPAPYARRLIFKMEDAEIIEMVEDGKIVPGWGNAFHKTSVDPSFAEMAHLVREEYPQHDARLQRISELIFKGKGRVLYPNPAAYTAVCAEILGLPEGVEMMLVLLARLPAWAVQWSQSR